MVTMVGCNDYILDEENQCVVVATWVCLGPPDCCSGYRSRLRTTNVL